MPTYQITAPDGKKLRITAPEGATQEQVLAYAQQNYKGQQAAQPKEHPQPQPERPGNALTHVLGELGGRQVMQGAASLLGAVGGDAFNHYVLEPIGLHDGRTYRQTASDLADRMGMRKPQTASERVFSDIGEGLTGTALTLGGGALLGPTSRLGKLLTTQPALQAVSTATGAGAQSIARESGAGEGAQIAAGLGGGLSPGIASAGTGALARLLVRGRSGSAMQRAISDFNALGANPSVGQASGNHAIQGAENLLAGAPTSAGVMNRFAERQASDIGGGLRNMADDFSRNASGERAGRAIERGVKSFADDIAQTRNSLYGAADSLVPPQTAVPLSNTRATLASLTSVPAGAAATGAKFVNPQIKALAADIERDLAASRTAGPMGTLAPTQGGIPYETVSAIRTRLGKELSDFSLSTDRPTAQLKQLYAALSKDIEQAAAQQGPAAAQAAKRASNYYKLSADRLDLLQRVVDKNGGPEKVFSSAMSGTRDGGTTIRAVMQSLPEDGQKAITAAVLKRMGLATPGVQGAAGETFSAQTLLTNWNKVSPEAKRALFDRYGPSFSRDMDRIARVAENIRDGAKVFANPSGSANRAASLTYGASLVASLFDLSGLSTAGLVSGGAAANMAARQLTNPRFVKWLASTTAAPVGSAVAQINTLRRIGERENDPDLVALANALSKEAAAQK